MSETGYRCRQSSTLPTGAEMYLESNHGAFIVDMGPCPKCVHGDECTYCRPITSGLANGGPGNVVMFQKIDFYNGKSLIDARKQAEEKKKKSEANGVPATITMMRCKWRKVDE